MTIAPRAASAFALLLAAATACSRDAPAARAAEPATPPASRAAGALPRLLFFMNPNGMPCQLQDRVLREMEAELGGRAEIVRVRTTERADLAEFVRYGIRALPSSS